ERAHSEPVHLKPYTPPHATLLARNLAERLAAHASAARAVPVWFCFERQKGWGRHGRRAAPRTAATGAICRRCCRSACGADIEHQPALLSRTCSIRPKP